MGEVKNDATKSFFSAGGKSFDYGGAINDSCIQFELKNEGISKGFEGLVAQSVQVNIGRQTQTLYELGSTKYYIVNGKPSGNGSLTNVIGPNTVTITSLKALGDVCKPSTITISKQKCECKESSNGDEKYEFTGGVLTGVGVSLQATTFYGQGTWSFSFQDFQCAGTNG